jgi:hypothetical protein
MKSRLCALGRARRASVKRGERPAKKTAITKTELEAMLASCDDSLEGIRDRALLCLPAVGDGVARSRRRRWPICGAPGRVLSFTGWSTARPNKQAHDRIDTRQTYPRSSRPRSYSVARCVRTTDGGQNIEAYEPISPTVSRISAMAGRFPLDNSYLRASLRPTCMRTVRHDRLL